jgi:hypothetical protein
MDPTWTTLRDLVIEAKISDRPLPLAETKSRKQYPCPRKEAFGSY